MITEDFLKIILKLVFAATSEKQLERQQKEMEIPANDKEKFKTIEPEDPVITSLRTSIYNSSLEILDYYAEKEIPLNIAELFTTTRAIIKHIVKNNYNFSKDLIKDVVNMSVSVSDYINYIKNLIIPKDEYIALTKHLSLKNKFVKMFEESDVYIDFIKKIKSGDYTDLNETITEYETILNKIYFEFSLKKESILDSDASITEKQFPTTLTVDETILDKIQDMNKYYENVTSIRSGFKVFDEQYSSGGFESGRIYIGAAPPGFGKSLWLLSCVVKAAKYYDTPQGAKEITDGKKNLFVYITAENQIYETLIRYASMASDIPITPSDIRQGLDKDKQYNLSFKNSIIEIKYVKAYTSTAGDIMVIIDKLLNKYDVEKKNEYAIRALYVDYLDLFKSMQYTDLYRLELGYVTMELKNIGIRYNIPVVTLTQLNDYSDQGGRPKLNLLKESKGKGEHADTVIFLDENVNYKGINNDDEKVLDIHIIKNRGYKKGSYSVYIHLDYKKLVGCTGFGKISKETEYIDSYLKFAGEYKKLPDANINSNGNINTNVPVVNDKYANINNNNNNNNTIQESPNVQKFDTMNDPNFTGNIQNDNLPPTISQVDISQEINNLNENMIVNDSDNVNRNNLIF